MDYLILWLDCDREGENICFEVIENCLPNMKQPANASKMSHVLRAKFSGIKKRMKTSQGLIFLYKAITKEDVRRAMDNLVKPNENEARCKHKNKYKRSVRFLTNVVF